MLTLTDVAVEKIKHLLKHKTYKGIRIGVRTTGCSGLAYTLEYTKDEKFSPYDDRIVYPDFIILVSLKDKVYLRGMVVDYKRNGLNEGFDFQNPNERDRCGCGESFRV
jgi:iron-sulfur cluster assembly protein